MNYQKVKKKLSTLSILELDAFSRHARNYLDYWKGLEESQVEYYGDILFQFECEIDRRIEDIFGEPPIIPDIDE